ncbi:MAG: hypothetical protein GC158_02720 [Cyanobacteria bacterium RI_101]|nr:hypothetical protein [Cyanobacteria bacterium RI_101]
MSADMSESVLSAPQSLVYEWNLAEDFLIVPNQLNPNPDTYGNSDVWYFLRSTSLTHNPATYDLLSEFVPDVEFTHIYFDVGNVQQWRDNGYLPYISINSSGVDIIKMSRVGVYGIGQKERLICTRLMINMLLWVGKRRLAVYLT